MLANVGRGRLFSSSAADRVPIVSRLQRMNLSPAGKTVKGRDSSDSFRWWKAGSKTSLVKVGIRLNIGIMSSTSGIGRWGFWRASFRLRRSTVTLTPTSGLGTSNRLSSHVTGP